MKKTEKKKTGREQVIEILGRVYPESDFSDDEVLFGRILEDYNSYADLINDYEAAIERAREEGEVAGRNARIDQLIEIAAGDGVPRLGGAQAVAGRQRSSIFDLARQCK